MRLDVRGTGAPRASPRTSTPRPSSSTASRWSSGWRAQEWCNGSVGSWGKSYGGFSCIQLAARRPPALRRDRTGLRDRRPLHRRHALRRRRGVRVRAQQLSGPHDRDERAPARRRRGPSSTPAGGSGSTRTPPWVLRWLREQHDGPYWRNGSLRPDFDARSSCPVVHRHAAGTTATARPACAWPQRLRRSVAAAGRPLDARRPRPRRARRRATRSWRELIRFFSSAPGAPSPPASARDRSSSSRSTTRRRCRTRRSPGAGSRARRGPTDARRRCCTLGEPAVAPASAPPSASRPATGARRHRTAACSATSAATRRAARASTSEPLTDPVDGARRAAASASRIRHPGPAGDRLGEAERRLARRASPRRSRAARVNLACAGEARRSSSTLMATGWRFRPGHRIRVAVAANDWPCLWPLPALHAAGGDHARGARSCPGSPRTPCHTRPKPRSSPVTADDAVARDRPVDAGRS